MNEANPAVDTGHSRSRSLLGLTAAGRAVRRSLTAVIARLARAVGTEIAALRSLRELDRMSERGLRDFGLSRGDVERVIRHGRLRPPRF